MKLGVLSQWFAPEPGGAVVPSVLARTMAARGHDVEVLTGYPNYPTGRVHAGYRQRWRSTERLAERLHVTRVPLYPSHDGGAAKRAANYLSFSASAAAQVVRVLGDVDATWVYNSPATVPLVAGRLSRRRQVPMLMHVMDVWPDSVLGSGMADGLNRLPVARRSLDALVRRGYEAAARIAVTSPGQVDLLHARGVPRDKLALRPLWADESVFGPRPADRSLLPEAARDARLVVMYAGALGHVQKVDVAIRAVARARHANVHLVIAGHGIAEQSLKRLAGEVGATNVHFMGARPPHEMGGLTAAADLHLVSLDDTPLLRVTMPSKIHAILASARPIVATCHGDAAQIVRDADAGVTVGGASETQLAGVLVDLAQDRAALQSLGANGRRYYEQNLSLDVAMAHVEDLMSSPQRTR